MSRILKKIIAYVSLSVITLFVISCFPVRKGYIDYRLSNTQYEKLIWLCHQFDEGKLKNGEFDFIVIGSSSALYGFNDSVYNLKTINLGVNTGCRAMELYLLERFIKSGNKTKRIIKEYHILNTKNFDFFGLHPVLHYFVSPIWLLQHKQSFFQPHLISFIFKRCRVVFQSWFYFHLNLDYNEKYTDFGYRSKKNVISKSKHLKVIKELPLTSKESSGDLRSWYHNYSNQTLFRIETDKLAEKFCEGISYVYFPTLNSLTAQTVENENLNEHINSLTDIIGLDLTVLNLEKGFTANRFNWSDPGHFTSTGSQIFSDSLINYYLQLK